MDWVQLTNGLAFSRRDCSYLHFVAQLGGSWRLDVAEQSVWST